MNYYYHKNICSCCKRGDVQHIGKSSFGWAFSFQATDEIKSYKDWLNEFEKNSGEIHDEDGAWLPLIAFKQMVEQKRGGKNHALEYPNGNFVDADGNSFSEYEFS